MKTIVVDGVIGWDIFAADVRQAIRDAAGDDLEIEVNSPGGIVTEGIAIYNAIKNAPGKKTTRITGLAASMGSYIALAAERVTAEANAIYMIHNAGMIAMGDHNDLRKAADIAEGMSRILAAAYIAKSGRKPEDIRAMMDAETYLYGSEIREAGFADEIIGEPAGDKAEAVLRTRAAVAMAEDLVKRLTTPSDADEAAAVLAEYLPKPKNETAGVAGVQAAGPKASKEVTKMTDQEIAALRAEAYQAGIQAERQRVAKLYGWKGITPDADRVVEEAVAAGKTYDDVAASLHLAVAKNKQADGENAPAIATATATNGAGVVGAMDEIDRQAMDIFGLTAEEYRKFGKGE